MSPADFQAILPVIVLSAATIIVMLSIAIGRNHTRTMMLTIGALALTFGALWIAAQQVPRQVTPLLLIDRYALLYTGVLVAATAAVALLSYGYLKQQQGPADELYLLLLLAATGAAVLTAASHFVSFFLGLEILSIPLYALIGYQKQQQRPLEAALKYLVLAAASAAFLLFGMALVYADLGTMEFKAIANAVSKPNTPLLLPGLALIIAGFGFKLAVVPFHLWTPDVYEGAPAPVTAFVATVSKGAMVALLVRFFEATAGASYVRIHLVFTIVALASMIGGNLLALLQDNVKRILAYSSIAHLGYILVAFQAGGSGAVTFYVVAYIVTTLGAFGIVTALSTSNGEPESIAAYRGLFWRKPALAAVFTAMLFSLAGIPLTAGFLAKFYVVAAGIQGALWVQVITLIVTSAIGLYYYLRIIVTLYASPEPGPESSPKIPQTATATLAILSALVIYLGVYPSPLLDVIRSAMALR